MQGEAARPREERGEGRGCVRGLCRRATASRCDGHGHVRVHVMWSRACCFRLLLTPDVAALLIRFRRVDINATARRSRRPTVTATGPAATKFGFGKAVRAQGFGSRVQGSGFRVKGLGFGFRVQGANVVVAAPEKAAARACRAPDSARRANPPPPSEPAPAPGTTRCSRAWSRGWPRAALCACMI